MLYINDICDVCTSFMKLYADDTKMYQKIKSRKYVHSPQKDLDALLLWSNIYEMNFNISKCKFMSIYRKEKIHFDYSMENNIISMITDLNDIRITITFNLFWCENVGTVSHIQSRTSSARKNEDFFVRCDSLGVRQTC